MTLTPTGEGTYVANGSKYYIGNANAAALVSTFGKIAGTGEYVFFAVDQQKAGYTCVQNVVHGQNYVAEYALTNHPITEDDILLRGDEAWDAALNTVNIGKFNLGWASIGICTHAFYEAIHHAAHRELYGMKVTDFPHAQALFTDAYARLVAMKLVAQRSSDYMRSATPEDRRYLLYNPVVKMKVTTQGEDVINHMWDVIAAKGFEKDTFFEMAARDIRALPKLEGTVHVNIALIVKFMENYFFHPADLSPVPRRDDDANDDFLFNQGPTRGLGKIRFDDPDAVFARFDQPNVAVFRRQIAAFKKMLVQAAPTREQAGDIDYLLAVGEIFTLAVYGRLFLESTEITGVDGDLIDQVFDVLVRDWSRFAVNLHGKPTTSKAQAEHCLAMIRRPASDADRFGRVWKDQVLALRDAYEMSPRVEGHREQDEEKSMRRFVIIGIVMAVLTAACGGGDDADTTSSTDMDETVAGETSTTEAAATTMTELRAQGAEFALGIADDGAVLRVGIGDTITARLPIDDPGDTPWIIAQPPDPVVLGIGDSFTFVPSEPGAAPSYIEFVFWVFGSGTTEVIISQGPLSITTPSLTFTVEVAAG
jgi:acyl-CoA dehydrogenase